MQNIELYRSQNLKNAYALADTINFRFQSTAVDYRGITATFTGKIRGNTAVPLSPLPCSSLVVTMSTCVCHCHMPVIGKQLIRRIVIAVCLLLECGGGIVKGMNTLLRRK